MLLAKLFRANMSGLRELTHRDQSDKSPITDSRIFCVLMVLLSMHALK